VPGTIVSGAVSDGSWEFRLDLAGVKPNIVVSNWLENRPGAGLIVGVKTFSAHFDGKHVVLDEPVTLAPNTVVTVVIK
jgi:hypothetical protein